MIMQTETFAVRMKFAGHTCGYQVPYSQRNELPVKKMIAKNMIICDAAAK